MKKSRKKKSPSKPAAVAPPPIAPAPPDDDDDDQLLTLDEVARKMNVGVETVRQLCISGKLPFVNVGTGEDRLRRRIVPSTLWKFMHPERPMTKAEQDRIHYERMRAEAESVEQRW